ERSVEHDPLRQLLGGTRAGRQGRQNLVPVRDEGVYTQRRLSRLVHAAQQRQRLIGAELLPPARRQPAGHGVTDRRFLGLPLVASVDPLAPRAGGTAQARVPESGPAPARALRQLDAVVDRRVVRNAPREQQLEQTEAQGREYRGIEALDRPRGE